MDRLQKEVEYNESFLKKLQKLQKPVYKDVTLEMIENAVLELYKSKEKRDDRMMMRELSNGLIEIHGNGLYMTCTAEEYMESLNKAAGLTVEKKD